MQHRDRAVASRADSRRLGIGACNAPVLGRHDDRERRAAAHAGQPAGDAGPDRVDRDLLYRRVRGRDAARRAGLRRVSACALLSASVVGLHGGLGALRSRHRPRRSRRVPDPAGDLRCGTGAAVAGRAAAGIPARPTWSRDGALESRCPGRPRHRADARRLAHGTSFSWRWAFFINVPFGILSFSCACGAGIEKTHEATRRRPFDWTGFVLLSLALGAAPADARSRPFA